MNEDLQKKFFEKALKYLNSAEAFTTKEVPLYVDEVLKYGVYEEAMGLAWSLPLFLIATFSFYLMYIKVYDNGKKSDVSRDIDVALTVVIFSQVLPLLIGLLLLVSNTLDLIKIHVAPRVYLIEYFTKS